MENRPRNLRDLPFDAVIDPSRFEEALTQLANYRAHKSRQAEDSLSISKLEELLSDELQFNQAYPLFKHVYDHDHEHDHLAIVFDLDGKVILSNPSARDELGAMPGAIVTDLKIDDQSRSALKAILKELKVDSTVVNQHTVIPIRLRDHSQSFSWILTLNQVANHENWFVKAVLIKDIDQKEFINSTSKAYAVSSSEKEVLRLFIEGKSLHEIADIRGRSLATIRSQYYSIANKFDVTSQAKLTERLLALSAIFSNFAPKEKNPDRPFRLEGSVLRPNGRVIEVVLSGDRNGIPVLHIATTYLRCFPLKTEKMLKDAGILIITVVTLGRGKTTPLDQDDQEQIVCPDDIIAILDQLSIQDVILFGTDDILREGVFLAKTLGSRLRHILITSPVLPSCYEEKEITSQNFHTLTRGLHTLQPSLRMLAMRMFWRSLSLLRARGMITVFSRNDGEDLKTYMEPETLNEIEAAIGSVLSAGFERCSKFHLSTFDDWQLKVDDCGSPITIYEGSFSRLCDPNLLEKFVANHCSAVDFVNFKTKGTSMPYARPDLMIKMIISISCPT